MKKSSVRLGLGGVGVVAAVLVAATALFPGQGTPPPTNVAAEVLADMPAEDTNVQNGGSASGMPDEGPAVAVPESELVITPPSNEAAPDFRGIVRWINSPPLSLQELQGKVVLVDFWTYSCINCQRTLPYVRDWYDKYSDLGLVVVGVHSPEFSFEKIEANVRDAVIQQQVTWPVAMDNDFSTWHAYENRWWPHEFLIDKDGLVRYDHIGEGAYPETEMHIRNLLTEAGYDVSRIPVGSP